MNNEQWTSLIRTVLTLLLGPGSYLIMKGVLSQDQANQLIPVLVPLIMVVGGGLIGKWGIGTHSAAAVVSAATSSANAVAAGAVPSAVLSSALVDAVNSPTVQGVKAVASSSPSAPVSVNPSTGTVKPLTPQGTPMALIAALGVIVSLGMILASHGPAYAAGRLPVPLPIDPLGLNSGGILKSVTGEPLVKIGPCLPTDTKCSLSAVLDVRDQLVANLKQADDTQAGVLNPATGEAWDPYLHVCLTGSPAIGTPGQDGYVAAAPGLIDWLQNLQQPTLASVPKLPENPSLATIAENGRLKVLAGMQDVSVLANTINAGGFPASVSKPCLGFVQSALVDVPLKIAGQVTVLNSLLLRYLPK